jgi:hypothetical protein
MHGSTGGSWKRRSAGHGHRSGTTSRETAGTQRLRRLPSALIIRASSLPYLGHLDAAQNDLDAGVGKDGVEQGLVFAV